MRLRDLVGQDRVVTVLQRALASGRLPHAYLFEGPPGVGKRTAAAALGLALDCPVEPGTGCGRCEACRRIADGLHPDVLTFSPELWCPERSGKGCGRWVPIGACSHPRADELPVAAARYVVTQASVPPHEAAARVIVVDDAERMTPEAANALLKTLEEPAPRIHLVLCSSAPERLLPTIRSRLQRVRFVPLATEVLIGIAEAHGIERARAETAIALADGSAGRMLALAAGAGDDAVWEPVKALRAAAGSRSINALFDAAAAAGEKEAKGHLPETLALLARVYRDGLATAAGAPDLAALGSRPDLIGDLGERDVTGLRGALDAIVEAREALEGNANAPLALERMLLQMRRVLP